MRVCFHVYLGIRKMDNSSDSRDGREKLGLFCFYYVLVLPQSSVVLFKHGLGLVENVYCELQYKHFKEWKKAQVIC